MPSGFSPTAAGRFHRHFCTILPLTVVPSILYNITHNRRRSRPCAPGRRYCSSFSVLRPFLVSSFRHSISIQAFRIIPSPSQIPAHRATNQAANNSPCPLTSSKMQFQPLQQLPRTARLRIPEFLALLPPCFSYSWRAPKTPAAASRFTAIRRAPMRNDLHAFMFTPFCNSHHCTTFRPVDTRPRSQPLRFFRDLIIFRANPAQMRNKCRPNVSRETSALVPPPPMP
jgi:hypothetical protein